MVDKLACPSDDALVAGEQKKVKEHVWPSDDALLAAEQKMDKEHSVGYSCGEGSIQSTIAVLLSFPHLVLFMEKLVQ